MSAALATAARRWSGGALRWVESAPGALGRVAELLDELTGGGPVLVLCDQVLADAPPVRSVLAALRGRRVRRLVVPVGAHGDVVLDEVTVSAARAHGAGCAAVVVVGSGTMTDLGKLVAAGWAAPLLVVQTAASVNGFADPLSVVVRRGAKRTVPSTWPTVLVIDHDVLEQAPVGLTRAGVGDVAAVWTAPADWYLACGLGLDGGFDPAVVEPVLSAAAGLRDGPDRSGATSALVDALTLGGLVLGGAGTTAPLSGVEHLISHVLDMTAIAAGRGHDRHGAQVGVASIVAAALWQVAMDELDVLGPDLSRLRFGPELREQVLATWAAVDPSGALGAECWVAVQRKADGWDRAGATVARFVAERDRHETQLRRWAAPPQLPAGVLAAWGAPTRFSGLEPAPDAEAARAALLALPFMRDRLTVVDLLVLEGRWDSRVVDLVLERAAAVGGGL
jgi:glycerol-1-phosphate dehydrogenase [NAD(P)+]